MHKKEWVYREILYQLQTGNTSFNQRTLSAVCNTSIGNVNQALKQFEHMNAIDKKHRGFTVIDPKKILFYWASTRRLEKDIVYQTLADMSVDEIEKTMPPCLFTAYSGYKFTFHATPSDYSEVFTYVSSENVDKIQERFPQRRGTPNVIVLDMDTHLKKFRKIPLAQLFVDLWNINTWYAREFLNVLEERMDGILE